MWYLVINFIVFFIWNWLCITLLLLYAFINFWSEYFFIPFTKDLMQCRSKRGSVKIRFVKILFYLSIGSPRLQLIKRYLLCRVYGRLAPGSLNWSWSRLVLKLVRLGVFTTWGGREFQCSEIFLENLGV